MKSFRALLFPFGNDSKHAKFSNLRLAVIACFCPLLKLSVIYTLRHQGFRKFKKYFFCNLSCTSLTRSFFTSSVFSLTEKSTISAITLKSWSSSPNDSIMCFGRNQKISTKNLFYWTLFAGPLILYVGRKTLIEGIFSIPKRATRVSVWKADKSLCFHKQKENSWFWRCLKLATNWRHCIKNTTF